MKKVVRLILNFLNRFSRILGVLITVIIGLGLLFWFVIKPIRIASFNEPTSEHLQEKKDYLASLGKVADSVPNIIIINFDDLGYGDLSTYGNKLIKTPAMDRLANEGVKMTDFYSCSPVCTPSRAGLLTGRFPIRSLTANGVFFPEDHPMSDIKKLSGLPNNLPVDEILLPEVLQKVGYSTGMIGKWHLGDKEGHLPNDFGFDYYYGVHFSNDMLPLHIYENERIVEEDRTEIADGYGNLVTGKRSYFDPETPLKVKGNDQTELTDKYTKRAISFIEEQKDQPFFLYFAHSFPHVPHFPSKKHAGQSEGGLYGDVVEDLDRSVASLMASLEKLQLVENTLVLITSDNGADFNGSSGALRGRKMQTYEGGQKVPFIAYWKGRLTHAETNEMAMNTDVFPTVLNLLDLPLPSDRIIDGKNIFEVLEAKTETPHEALYYFATQNGKPLGVRNATFKFHEGAPKYIGMFPGMASEQIQKPQLTHIELDNESHNLIKKYPAEAEILERSLRTLHQELKENKRGWIIE